MSYKDLFKKKNEPHADTPEQAAARTAAAAEHKAKADAKASRSGSSQGGAARGDPAAEKGTERK